MRKETREFNGQIQYIHDHLNVYYDTSRQNALLQKRFVGRAWLEKKLEHWMDDPAGKRMCLLYGGPGVGKSAFAVHYTGSRGPVPGLGQVGGSRRDLILL